MKIKDIDGLWQDGSLPVVNGVVFRSGRVTPFTITGYGQQRKISPASPYDMDDFLKNEDAVFSSIDSLAELKLDNKHGVAKAIAGEGSYGSDGFVVALDGNDRICWAAVFDHSNPFVRLMQRGDDLVAINNLEESWIFPLFAPDSFYVEEVSSV